MLTLESDAPESMRPQKQFRSKARVFCTDNETDLRDLSVLTDDIVRGWAVEIFSVHEYDRKKGSWRIFKQWAQIVCAFTN